MNYRRLLLAAIVLLLVLHQDFWNWHQLSWFAGLPAGFAYHLGFCVVVSLVMALLLRVEGSGKR